MPTIKITKSAIDSFPVTAKETVYWEAGLPGFGVKVTPKAKGYSSFFTAPVGLARGCANTRSAHMAG